MIHRRLAGVSAVAALVALAPSVAHAHVTLQPDEVPAGGFARLDVRVPNERDDAGTSKVAVQFPDGFASVSYEPEPGWKVRVVKEKTDKPVELHGEPVNEQIDQVVFTASDGEEIQPGEFRDFGLSLALPEGEQTLTFKALQTYEGGEVVRWIGSPEADEPAPQVKLTAVAEDPAAAAGPAEAEDEEDDGNGLAITALVVAALALATAAFTLVRRRGAGTA